MPTRDTTRVWGRSVDRADRPALVGPRPKVSTATEDDESSMLAGTPTWSLFGWGGQVSSRCVNVGYFMLFQLFLSSNVSLCAWVVPFKLHPEPRNSFVFQRRRRRSRFARSDVNASRAIQSTQHPFPDVWSFPHSLACGRLQVTPTR